MKYPNTVHAKLKSGQVQAPRYAAVRRREKGKFIRYSEKSGLQVHGVTSFHCAYWCILYCAAFYLLWLRPQFTSRNEGSNCVSGVDDVAGAISLDRLVVPAL